MSNGFRNITINVSGTSIQKGLVIFALSTALLFIMVGLIATSHVSGSLSSSSIQKWVSGISNETWLTVMETEIPLLQLQMKAENAPSKKSTLSGFLFEILTSIDPEDPRTFLGRELPGFNAYDIDILVRSDDVNYTHFPGESVPPSDGDLVAQPPAEPTEKPPSDSEQVRDGSPNHNPILTTGDKQVIFIYHTHNTESWLTIPELQEESNPNRAYHSEKNITLVGKKLAEELKKRGIGSQVNTDDHMGIVGFNQAYSSSLKSVRTALANNDDISYIFDIHRDASNREQSTITLDGKTYARIYFVIGKQNPHWEKNFSFAKQIHQRINEKYPRLSKGIIGKSKKDGHGEYNQTLSPNSVIIEVGGYANSIKETYRTAEVLAGVIAEMYWDAKEVYNNNGTKPEET